MPLSQWNLEWLNHNSQRAYPLYDDTTGLDTTESFRLPNDFLVELDLPIHAALNFEPSRFFIRTLGVFATGFSIVIAHQNDAGVVDVATALIPRHTHTRNKVYALGGVEPFDDTVGKVTIGKLETIDEQPAGFWEFDSDATRLEARTIRPIIRGVQALVVVDGATRSSPLTGDIEIEAGPNIQITPVIVSGEDPKLVISAISGEGTIEECICEGEEAELPCIRTINGVAPTPNGKFNLVGDDCIQIETTTNGMKLVDTCCQPCCGCVELESVTRDLERLRSEREGFNLFIEQLNTSVTEMNLTVLGARLGDQGCITCE